jgi:acetate kinase
MLILVCNVGSTSLKYKLFDMPSPDILAEGKVERVGRMDAIFTYKNNKNGFSVRLDNISIPDYAAGINVFLNYLLGDASGVVDDIGQLDAIGFKTVVSKGYYGIHELTDDVIKAMEEYISVAPAHNPPYIEAIKVFRSILPERLMVGCFETAFHTTIPLSRRIYALPYTWYEQYGICRLGYHGASHGYISRRIKERAGEQFRLISCHLGGSGSICAIENGKSVDTSFGFSLQTGIPHANRSGDMDAYIIPYLLNQGLTMEEITRGIDKNGGLLGISGISNDLRDIEDAAGKGNERAILAIDTYCDAIIRYIGAFYAELGGMDHLVFTGGIGENSALIRDKVCSRLACLGVEFDSAANRNANGECVISTPDSPVTVLVLPTNEEIGIARAIFEQFTS